MSVNGELVGATSARRRRERRLRSWWRHEALSVAAALATARQHSAGPEVVTRREGQQEEVEVEQHDGLRAQNTPPPGLVEAATVGYVAAGVPLLAPWKSRGRRRRRLWRRRSWSSWRRSLLRRRSGCLRCPGGTGTRGPRSLVRPGPRSPASISTPFTGSWPKRRLGRRGKRGRTRRGGGCGRLAGLCSAALRDVSYDSLFSLLVGFYGPLYLAVTCPMFFLPEEYSTWFTLGDHFWRDSVFSADWFDSGYMVLPVYGGFVRISYFQCGLLGSCVRFSSCSLPVQCLLREEYRKLDCCRARVDNGSCMLWLVLLVSTHLALCFLLLFSGPDARHHGRYEPEGFLRVFIPAVACARLVFLVHACGMFPSFLAGS